MIMVMTDSYDDYGDDNKVIIKLISFPVYKHYYKKCQCQQIQGKEKLTEEKIQKTNFSKH